MKAPANSVKNLKGVGPAKATAYEKLGIRTTKDLLYHFPRSYENRGDICTLADAPEDARCALVLTVGTEPRSARIRGRMTLLKFRAYDESGTCEITFFNQDYLKHRFLLGSTFRFWGKVQKTGKNKKTYKMLSPESEEWREDQPLPDLSPVYRLSEGLSPKLIGQNMEEVLASTATMTDPLPDRIRQERRLATLGFALRNIHNPKDYMSLAAAKKRLIFDEFFTFALGLALTREKGKEGDGAPACTAADLAPLTALLPYELTGAQQRAISEIRADMMRTAPMSRIVVGDVGCGKTVCAAAAMLFAVQSGRQAALMAPTEILARQHFEDLSPIFHSLGIRAELLIGATTAAKKRKIKEELLAEDPAKRLPIVIGTQALLSDGVGFAAPGLIVTDEQHRFGVNQRAVLSEKNKSAHVLVMSATPIPRSLALALYGDLSLSRIDEMPKGRQRVDTFAVDESYRQRMNAFIEKTCAEGGQVYVVCPAVEERDAEPDELLLSEIGEEAPLERAPLKAAVQYAEELKAALPALSIGIVHGKMKSKEKEAIMQSFAAGEVQVLVSTTVIEVGVNVPNASLMIVENAERFGLSQLHQLRGRVGRGTRKSYCILMSATSLAGDSTAARRLSTMKTTYDGFEIAEKDLALRGPGDFLSGATDSSIRQSGGVKFRLAALCDDTGLLTAAFADAKALIAEDPALAAYPALRASVDAAFTLSPETIS